MKHQIFVKQSHKNIKIAFLLLFSCFFSVITIGMIVNKEFNWVLILLLIVTLIIFILMSKLFESYGIYVSDEKIFYKTLKVKEIDINTIVGIKVLKSEGQVNLAWSSFDIKDKKGNTLYSMVFLSNVEDGMKEYLYGDIGFLRKYKKSIIMYSIYDERIIDIIKERRTSLEIIDCRL